MAAAAGVSFEPCFSLLTCSLGSLMMSGVVTRSISVFGGKIHTEPVRIVTEVEVGGEEGEGRMAGNFHPAGASCPAPAREILFAFSLLIPTDNSVENCWLIKPLR